MLKSFKHIKKFGELAYAVNSLWNDYDYCLWKYLEILVLWNIEISLDGIVDVIIFQSYYYQRQFPLLCITSLL